MKSILKLKFKWLYLLTLLVFVIIATVVVDVIRISGYETYPLKPDEPMQLQQDQVYYDLVNGIKQIGWSRLDGTLEFINRQYDCSDFRLVNLIRIISEFEAQIPASIISKIENALLGFRYWWDEPGGNSMCYWSENHQILYWAIRCCKSKKRLF